MPHTVPSESDTFGPTGGSGGLSCQNGPMGYDAPMQFNGHVGSGSTDDNEGARRPDEVLGHSQVFGDVSDHSGSGSWKGADYMSDGRGWTEC
jgi:hypothetical protein